MRSARFGIGQLFYFFLRSKGCICCSMMEKVDSIVLIVNLVHLFDNHYDWDNNLFYLNVSFTKSKGLYLERRVYIFQNQITDKISHDMID